MNRKPTFSPSAINFDEDARTFSVNGTDYVTEVRRYKLLTPLFGGGVEGGVNDPVTLIRGSAIRGHLRFWWRATRSGQFNGALEDMKHAENAIWGSASGAEGGPSKVHIVVEEIKAGAAIRAYNVRSNTKGEPQAYPDEDLAPSYASFPLQPNDKDTPLFVGMSTKMLTTNVSFQLTMSYPLTEIQVDHYQLNMQIEIHAALWAWETFGGIGARTRRGFGALHCTYAGKSKGRVDANKIRASIKSYLVDDTILPHTVIWPHDIPHLSSSMHWDIIDPKRTEDSNENVWHAMITKLKEFRHQRSGYGRNHWPEPDAIRRLTTTSNRHSQAISTIDKFPRAAFGLPIVFHFKDSQYGDPEDVFLTDGDFNRFSSSLIMRPLLTKKSNKDHLVGLVAILSGPLVPQTLRLQNKTKSIQKKVDTHLTTTEAAAIPNIRNQRAPLLNGQTNILEAFLDYIKKEMA